MLCGLGVWDVDVVCVTVWMLELCVLTYGVLECVHVLDVYVMSVNM